jgi:hypothetical protein
MKNQISIALAAGLLLAGVSAASAADTQSSTAKDTLSLSTTQQKTAWNDLNSAANAQNAPPSFFRSVGEVVPSSVKLQPIPAKAASDVPALRPYEFAMIEGQLLIVNPSDRKIAEVITR